MASVTWTTRLGTAALWMGVFLLSSGLRAAEADPQEALLGAPRFLPSSAHPVGLRGDWTGRYPGATPPTRWSPTYNVVWSREVGLGESSPVVVGDRVFLLSNGVTLQCFERTSGRLLWERDHHIKAGNDSREWKLEEFVILYHRARPFRERIGRCQARINDLKRDAASNKAQPDPAALTALEAEMAAQSKLLEPLQTALKVLSAADLGVRNISAVTYAIAVPCSDGAFVYATLPIGEVVCYDLEGNLHWSRLLGGQKRSGGGWGGDQVGPSPCLADGKLIIKYDQIYCLRADDGEPLWQAPSKGLPITSPFAGRVGGTWYVCEGSAPILRMADGKYVYQNQDAISVCDVATGIFYEDIFHCGDHAVRVSPNPDEPPALLWRMAAEDMRAAGQNFTGWHSYAANVYVDGLIYHHAEHERFSVHDAHTGKLVHAQPCEVTGEIYPGVMYAGGYVFTANRGGVSAVFTRFNGRECPQVARNNVFGDPGGNMWFFAGDRAYWRITQKLPDGRLIGRLYCFGDPLAGSPARSFNLSDLDSGDDAVVWAALRALKARPEPALVPELQKRILDPDERRRRMTLLALRALGPAAKDAAPVLVSNLLGRPNRAPRIPNPVGRGEDAAWELLAHDALLAIGVAAMPAIKTALELKDDRSAWRNDSRCAEDAVRLLAELSPASRSVVPTLIGMLSGGGNDFRCAVRALCLIGSPEEIRRSVVPVLAEKAAIADPKKLSINERLEAVSLLVQAARRAGEGADQKAGDQVKGAIADVLAPLLQQPQTAYAAAVALSDLKSHELEAAQALAKYLPTVAENSGLVMQGLNTMDRFIGHADLAVRAAVIPGLLGVLSHEKAPPNAKRSVVERLARLGVEARPALDALRQAAASAKNEVAAAAKKAIADIEAAGEKDSRKP